MNLKAEQNHALSFFLKAIQTNNGTKKELFSGKIHEIVAAGWKNNPESGTNQCTLMRLKRYVYGRFGACAEQIRNFLEGRARWRSLFTYKVNYRAHQSGTKSCKFPFCSVITHKAEQNNAPHAFKTGCPDTLAEQNRNIPKRNKIVHLRCGFSAYKGFSPCFLTFFIIQVKSGTKSCTSKRLQAALLDDFCLLCGTK